jgi:hypothetical protein
MPVSAIGPEDAHIEGVSEAEWKEWLQKNTDWYTARK